MARKQDKYNDVVSPQAPASAPSGTSQTCFNGQHTSPPSVSQSLSSMQPIRSPREELEQAPVVNTAGTAAGRAGDIS